MNICHCGSVEEAIKAAEKQIIQLTASDCPVWAFQVAVAMNYLAMKQLLENDPQVFQEAVQAGLLVTEAAKTSIDITKMIEEAAEKRDALYTN